MIHAPRLGSDGTSCDRSRSLGNFNPRSPHRERRTISTYTGAPRIFQSTLPAWGATLCAGRSDVSDINFNPRSPHGERHTGIGVGLRGLIFQSTLHAWGATHSRSWAVRCVHISIHAPRMGSDLRQVLHRRSSLDFNPRSPHGERQGISTGDAAMNLFQSTLPAGGATLKVIFRYWTILFQSTLPAGGATCDGGGAGAAKGFQSTLPAGGATTLKSGIGRNNAISIHAPRRGSDSFFTDCFLRALNFNPRSPQGERRGRTLCINFFIKFQSTLPAGGATAEHHEHSRIPKFQSTLPAGGATYDIYSVCTFDDISIHAPRRGSDEHISYRYNCQ